MAGSPVVETSPPDARVAPSSVMNVFEGLPRGQCHTPMPGPSGGLCLKESLEVAPAWRTFIPEAGCKVTGCFWCLEHAYWVYRQAEQRADVGTVQHVMALTALQRLRHIREAGLAFARLRTDATQALTDQELHLRRELGLQQGGAVRAAI